MSHHALEWENWKSEQSWESENSNRNIMMNEEFVKNNSVMFFCKKNRQEHRDECQN